MFFIKPIAKLVAALNSNSKPGDVAAAISSAFLLALIPSRNLLWPVLVIISLTLRLNWGFEFVFIALFKGLIPLIDPLVEPLGWNLLQLDFISSIVYGIEEVPGLVFLGLNDSLMTGGLAAGIIAWIPLFFMSKLLINLFRQKLSPKIANSKILTAIKKVPLVSKLTGAVREYSLISQ